MSPPLAPGDPKSPHWDAGDGVITAVLSSPRALEAIQRPPDPGQLPPRSFLTAATLGSQCPPQTRMDPGQCKHPPLPLPHPDKSEGRAPAPLDAASRSEDSEK